MTTRRFILGSGIATSVRMIGRGVGYLAQIVLARILAPDSYGLFTIGWTILRFFSIAGHLGLDFGMIHFGSQYWKTHPSRFRSVFLLSIGGALLSGLFAGLLIFYYAPWIATSFFKKPNLVWVLRGFAFTFPFATVLRVLAATSSISGKMLCGGFAEDIAQSVTQILLFILLFSFGYGLRAALLSTLFSYAFAVAWASICVARLTPLALIPAKFLWNDFKPLFRYSLPTILAVSLSGFNLWGDRLIVGYFRSEAEAGIYQAISLITMFTVITLSGIKLVTAPTVANLFHSDKQENLESLGKLITRWILYISFPVLLVIILVPGPILRATFGEGYLAGTVPLIWMTFGQIFYATFGVSDQFLVMTGNQRSWLAIAAIGFAFTFTLDTLLVPSLGLLGAAIVSSSMMLLIGILTILQLKRSLQFWIIDFQHFKIYLAGVFTYFITRGVIHSFAFIDLFQILLAGVCVLGVFFASLLLLGVNTEDKANVMSLLGKRK